MISCAACNSVARMSRQGRTAATPSKTGLDRPPRGARPRSHSSGLEKSLPPQEEQERGFARMPRIDADPRIRLRTSLFNPRSAPTWMVSPFDGFQKGLAGIGRIRAGAIGISWPAMEAYEGQRETCERQTQRGFSAGKIGQPSETGTIRRKKRAAVGNQDFPSETCTFRWKNWRGHWKPGFSVEN